MPERVVSGGQTGVDRAALDAAMELGIEVGGWCPRGRRALDGRIPEKYPLEETDERSYQQRTAWNVRDSDATLILCRGTPTGGTALTIKCCGQFSKPFFVFQLPHRPAADIDSVNENLAVLFKWFAAEDIRVLNIAGPRESKDHPIYQDARIFLTALLRKLLHTKRPI